MTKCENGSKEKTSYLMHDKTDIADINKRQPLKLWKK